LGKSLFKVGVKKKIPYGGDGTRIGAVPRRETCLSPGTEFAGKQKKTPASLGYPPSVFNKNSTLRPIYIQRAAAADTLSLIAEPGDFSL